MRVNIWECGRRDACCKGYRSSEKDGRDCEDCISGRKPCNLANTRVEAGYFDDVPLIYFDNIVNRDLNALSHCVTRRDDLCLCQHVEGHTVSFSNLQRLVETQRAYLVQ